MTHELKQLDALLAKGNLAQADLMCLDALRDDIDDATPWLEARLTIARRLGLPAPNAKRSTGGGYLLIRAWGVGFWGEVSHVLACLLLAEITGRTPVVHWGTSSFFDTGDGQDSYSRFFEPVSEAMTEELPPDDSEYFPPKWTHSSASGAAIDTMQGKWSRMNGIYLLTRQEAVVVADFYTQFAQLMRWIPEDHRLFGCSQQEAIRDIASRYLRPRRELVARADLLVSERLGGGPFAAVHLRGLDMVSMIPDLAIGHKWLLDRVGELLAREPGMRLFVLTDDVDCLSASRERFGNQVVAADAMRTFGRTGLHVHGNYRKYRQRLGEEALIDGLIALRSSHFFGIGASAMAATIAELGDWKNEGAVRLIGESQCRRLNFFLNDW